MKRLLSFSASVALLAACGGGGGTSAPAETLPAGALVVTAVSGLRFDAETYGPVTAGSIVFGYKNDDSIRHTLILAKDDTKVPNFKLVVAKKGDVDKCGLVNPLASRILAPIIDGNRILANSKLGIGGVPNLDVAGEIADQDYAVVACHGCSPKENRLAGEVYR